MKDRELWPESRFDIEIDFKASHGAYIYDRNRQRYFLDFFGNYSSLALGYSTRDLRVPFAKIANCEIQTPEYRQLAHRLDYPGKYPHILFTNGGGLAVDAAIKTALYHNPGSVTSFEQSFHGVTGYGMTVTDRLNYHTLGFPKLDWPQLDRLSTDVSGNVIVEPIQCTYGDLMRPKEWFEEIRKKSKILIFDEVQTGFGATGTMWYYEQLGIEPDIVCFGKKGQVSGILSKLPIPDEARVTFDGTYDDILRSLQVLRDYDDFDLLRNAEARGKQLRDGIPGSWGVGLITAFKSDRAWDYFSRGLLVNKTVNGIIRLRPPMNVTEDEVNKAIEIIKLC